MSALDMLGGFTASAGPIGGAPNGGTGASSAADAGAAAGGAFESLVAKALQGSDSDVEPDLTDASDEDADPAESGLDLSLMLAMAGLTPFQVTAPQVVDNAAASTGTVVSGTEALGGIPASASSTAGASMTLDAPGSTVPPAGGIVESAVGAEASTVEADAQVGTETATAEPVTGEAPVVTAAPVVANTAASGASIAAPAAATNEPVEGESANPVAPGVSVASPAAPSASTVHASARARIAKAAQIAGNGVGSSAVDGDGAWQQATAELREAIRVATGAEAPAKTTSLAAQAHANGSTSRAAETGQASKSIGAETVAADTAIALSGGVVAAPQTMGQSGQFGGQGHAGGEEAGVSTAAVTLTGARAEAAVQAFTSLAAESPGGTAVQSGVASATSIDSAVPAVSPQESAQNVHAMVRAVRMQFLDGGGEARLQLNPEHLGQVTLTIKVEQGRVATHIQAETAEASRWIETHQSNLRSALEDQGLEVKELVVSTDPDGRRQQEQSQPHQKSRNVRRPDGQTPKFEVLV